jgi:hypothetical protein
MRLARDIGFALVAASLLLVRPVVADQPAAKLQALDKVTARISELRVPIDGSVTFGTLEITARACHKAPPEEPPENAAFLEVREARRNEAPRMVFSGWMFSSSPGLSTLEHPVYDIWVVDCLFTEADSSSAEPTSEDDAAPPEAAEEAPE